MDQQFFQRFLYESESDSLDFKRSQYKFLAATDEDKSELLKDILAMINSWRRVDGYIVLGIIDKPEKPNELVGINEHIDDARIQQFVNGKTNRVCEFDYKTHTVNGLTFGVLHFPVQRRPVYLKRNFGRLKAESVYVRRGSSTDEAKPDEISQMGILNAIDTRRPDLEVEFYDHKIGSPNGRVLEAHSLFFQITDEIPDYKGNYSRMYIGIGDNEDYYRELVDYINFKKAFFPIRFIIQNKGNVEAKNIRIEHHFDEGDFELLSDEIEEPSTSRLLMPSTYASCYDVESKVNRKCVYSKMDLLHANRKLDLPGVLYLNPQRSRSLVVQAKAFCDGIELPFSSELQINFTFEKKHVTWVDFKEYIKQELTTSQQIS